MGEPRVFDICCDARVSVSVLAGSLEEANERWDSIRKSIDQSQHTVDDTGQEFLVWLMDQEPEIEEQ